jgi:GNAT superfamily N-acetyltransferase
LSSSGRSRPGTIDAFSYTEHARYKVEPARQPDTITTNFEGEQEMSTSSYLREPADAPAIDRRLLLENHIEFFGTHRGTIRRSPSGIEINSESREFTCAFLEHGPGVEVLDRHQAVRLTPWSHGWDPALTARRYQPQGAIVYMAMASSPPERPAPANLEIAVVRTESEMTKFSEVQTRSFLDEGESYEELFKFLNAANLKNLWNPSQAFYLASVDGKPVGVTLMLYTQGVAGIYAVATLPSHRKQGICSALLSRAVRDGRERGYRTLCLQVVQGSDAEKLYTHLGFVPMFVTPLLFAAKSDDNRAN